MKNFRALWIIQTIILTSFLLFTGCTEQSPIKVGYVATLSGRQSEVGVSGRNGALLAVREINNSGGINGRPISLIVKDDKGNSRTAYEIDKQFYDQGIKLIIGHMTSGVIDKTIKLSEEKKVLFISPTISTESLSGKDDNFIRVIASNKQQAYILAEAAANLLKVGRVAVLYESSNKSYSGELTHYFEKKFKELGGKIISSNSYDVSANVDFYNLAKTILKGKPEAILSITNGSDNALLCQQLERFSSPAKVLGGMWSMTDELILHGGKSVSRMYFAGVMGKNMNNPTFEKFRNNYKKAFKSEPSFSSVYSYETVKLLAEVLLKKEADDIGGVKEEILKRGKFPGIFDEIVIDRFGDAIRPYYLFQVVDNKFWRVY